MRRTSLRGGTGVRVVVAVVAGLLVGGCTGGSDPVPTATPEERATTVAASPTPSPPPRPAVPEQPAAMAEPTKEGAAAAARYFFDLYEYAFSTGDAGPFARLSAEGCVFCTRTVEQVEQAVEDRLLTDRDPAEITDVSVVETRAGEWFDVTLRRRQGEIRLLRSDGSVLRSEPPGEVLHYGIALSWDRGWSVDEVGLVEEAQ